MSSTSQDSEPGPPAAHRRSPQKLLIISFAAAALALAVALVVVLATRDSDPATPTPPSAGDAPGLPQAGSPEPSPSTTLTTVKVGTPFTAEITYTDGTAPNTWQVTVKEVTCGISTIPKAADNPAYDGSNAKTVDAVPPAGQTFCRLRATMTNTGRTSGDPRPFGDIVLPAGEFTASPADEQISDNLNPEVRFAAINPGGTVQWSQVWTVPVGSTAVAVLYPARTAYSGPSTRVELV